MPRIIRAGIRLAKLALAFLKARLEADRRMTAVQRAAWQQRQARRMLSALEIDVTVTGMVPSGGLVICNHLGYLDILVIAAQGAMVFVAKSDVGNWPLVGSLLESAGTILAERQRPASAGKTVREIRDTLQQGLTVVLFPEGTSSDGFGVLPFKPALLQAAFESGSAISPAAISYRAEGGYAATDVCYWGDATFFPHLVRLAGLRRIRARLVFGAAAALPDNRKTAALQLHSEVSQMLAFEKSRVASRSMGAARDSDDTCRATQMTR